jgi:hypothetical protein
MSEPTSPSVVIALVTIPSAKESTAARGGGWRGSIRRGFKFTLGL